MKDRGYLVAVKTLPCALAEVWGHECVGMVDAHHAIGIQYRGMGQKASDYETIPLCHMGHHQFGKYAIHQIGRKPWEEKYGPQSEWIKKTQEALAEFFPTSLQES